MALITQSQNTTPRNPSGLMRLFGWVAVLHGCAFVLLMAFALAVGVL